MRKLLVIAYHFPPLASSGMYRSLEFVRYLPEHGWEPTVLTVRPETLPDPGILDPEPLGLIRPGTRILRVPAPEALRSALRVRDRLPVLRNSGGANGDPRELREERRAAWRDLVSDFFSVPDRQVGWVPRAASVALRLLGEERFDAVYSSSPPASAHLAAGAAARLSGVPWAADFRDPWVANDFAPPRSTRVLDPFDRCLERKVVGFADRVVVNTDEIREDFESRYPDIGTRFVTIPNGYDPDEVITPAERKRNGEPFTITHAGSLYGPRDPSALLRAVRDLIEGGSIRSGEIRLRFVGTAAGEERWRDLVDRPPLAGIVRFEPKVSRSEVLRLLEGSDLLLLIQTGTDLQIPRKAYEYMAVGRPVLALVTGGATENLVRQTGCGWVVHPDDPRAIQEALLQAMRGERAAHPCRRERFDFRRLTGELAAVLRGIAP
jgi:glycosyltransferase involved in cell wall biosynthesis